MNTPLSDKNIAAYNDQPLDTWHDIIISFDYARYNEFIPPTGGFAVVLFDSIIDKPRGGGPGKNLGYLPSDDTQGVCNLNGYPGLEGAFLAVGFDSTGEFASPTTLVTGVTSIHNNSIIVRDGIFQDYNVLYNSDNIQYLKPGLESFLVDSLVDSISSVQYNSVRIILEKTGTELRIQLKLFGEPDFITVQTIPLPIRKRTAVKVGITNTSTDPYTVLSLKNFNVAGYPGETTDIKTDTCEQNITLSNYGVNNILPVNEEYFTVTRERQLVTYTTDTELYSIKNIIYSGGGFKILGFDRNTVLATFNQDTSVQVFKYLGEKLARITTIPVPNNEIPTAADIDNNTLVICSSGSNGTVYIYSYNTSSLTPATIGTWSLYQTIYASSVLSGTGLGVSVQINKNNLIVGNENQIIHAFQKNVSNSWELLQSISSPMSGITLFGSVLQLQDNDLIVGAPYSQKINFSNPGQGEAYHYFLSQSLNSWYPVMALGNFYDINTPGGNFGTSISFDGDTCIIGSPGEMWADSQSQLFENNPNTGRAYVFRKTLNGIFSQASVLTPSSAIRTSYMRFGDAVGIYKNYAYVFSPFNSQFNYSYVTIFNTDCSFPVPPLHFPVPDCAYALFDGSGFIIDNVNNTYMVSLCCLYGW